MSPSRLWKSLAVVGFLCGSLTAGSPRQSNCSALATSLRVENATILATGYYQKGSVIDLPGLIASCATGPGPATVNATTDLCRVVVSVATTSTSRVLVEAWLPDEWNSRLIASGGGGISGCVDYNAVPYGASLGFASLGTNGGHNGSSGFDFFLNRPEVINDFGYRSIHVEAEVGKQIVQQYYGQSSCYNYYAGCSTGGRQGIKEATMYPDDFDGILAGSPGVHWFTIVSAYALMARRSGWPDIDSTSYVHQAQWEAIVAAQIRLLDPLDGVIDGVIDQAYMYNFDAELLRCGGGLLNDSVCLSPDQVASVRAAYEPISTSHGQFAFPSWGLGADTSSWSANVVNGTPSIDSIIEDVFRGVIYNDSSWTANDFSEIDMDFSTSINPGGIQTSDTDLSAFYQKGGKLLTYHGGADQAAPFALTMWFYSNVRQTLNLTMEQMQSFYRVIYVNGMFHCNGGPGAWNIGQLGPLDPRLNSSDKNALLALIDWTEKGKAPDSVVGSHISTSGGIQAQRTHCIYPKLSKWDGKNNPTVASSWHCE